MQPFVTLTAFEIYSLTQEICTSFGNWALKAFNSVLANFVEAWHSSSVKVACDEITFKSGESKKEQENWLKDAAKKTKLRWYAIFTEIVWKYSIERHVVQIDRNIYILNHTETLTSQTVVWNQSWYTNNWMQMCMITARYSTIQSDTAWCSTVQYDTFRCSIIQNNAVRYSMI